MIEYVTATKNDMKLLMQSRQGIAQHMLGLKEKQEDF